LGFPVSRPIKINLVRYERLQLETQGYGVAKRIGQDAIPLIRIVKGVEVVCGVAGVIDVELGQGV